MRTSLILGVTYLVSEVALNLSRRAQLNDGVRQDNGTLRTLWIVIMTSIALGIFVAARFPSGALAHGRAFALFGSVLFACGLALRWWAIIVLGRFFTVDVTIAKDHELVESGPFRVVRHPSYTGLLLAFVGFALSVGNWAAFLVIVIPILAAFIYRMDIEERALTAGLGDRYVDYMRRTKRLIPGLY